MLWQDDIQSNLASVAATRKAAAMGMGGEGHQFHAMDFLFYAYLQSGREADARVLMDEVKAMPEMHDMYGVGFDPHLATEAHFWRCIRSRCATGRPMQRSRLKRFPARQKTRWATGPRQSAPPTSIS